MIVSMQIDVVSGGVGDAEARFAGTGAVGALVLTLLHSEVGAVSVGAEAKCSVVNSCNGACSIGATVACC